MPLEKQSKAHKSNEYTDSEERDMANYKAIHKLAERECGRAVMISVERVVLYEECPWQYTGSGGKRQEDLEAGLDCIHQTLWGPT